MADDRADLSRAFGLVVALFCAVAPTSVIAREFSTGDTPNRGDPIARHPSRVVSCMAGLIEVATQQVERNHGME